MTTATTETPDGERLARVENRVEPLEGEAAEIKADLQDIKSKLDRHLLWILGVIITMWLSLVAMWITTMFTVVNKLAG